MPIDHRRTAEEFNRTSTVQARCSPQRPALSVVTGTPKQLNRFELYCRRSPRRRSRPQGQVRGGAVFRPGSTASSPRSVPHPHGSRARSTLVECRPLPVSTRRLGQWASGCRRGHWVAQVGNCTRRAPVARRPRARRRHRTGDPQPGHGSFRRDADRSPAACSPRAPSRVPAWSTFAPPSRPCPTAR